MPDVVPIILCGGFGKRLQPLSTDTKPKPFIDLGPNRTLFQEALIRANLLSDGIAPIICCNALHRHWVQTQTAALDIEPAAIIEEPILKNTGPALSVVSHYVQAYYGDDAVMIVLPSDQLVEPLGELLDGMIHGIKAAEAGYLTLFGITPDRPGPEFGHIMTGSHHMYGYDVTTFIEKPPEAVIAQLQRPFYWNSGMFVWQANTFLEALKDTDPELWRQGQLCAALLNSDTLYQSLPLSAYEPFTSIPIDKALMEKTHRSCVIPLDLHWQDIGSVESVQALISRSTLTH